MTSGLRTNGELQDFHISVEYMEMRIMFLPPLCDSCYPLRVVGSTMICTVICCVFHDVGIPILFVY